MKTLFAAAVAVSLLTGTAAYADNDHWDRGRHERRDDRGRHDNHGRYDDHKKDRRDYRGHERRDYDRHDRRDYDRHDRHDRWDRRDHRWDGRDAYRAGYYHGRVDQHRYDRGRYIAPRGYYVRSWRHGDYLPRSYCESRYIVHDYRSYRLGAPPHGHHWVRVNNDVVLAAITSGLVVSVVNGLFY